LQDDGATNDGAALRCPAITNLARIWGYRAGDKGDHTAYELGTHDEVRSILAFQAFTDPLMRNLEQIGNGQTCILENDVISLARRQVDVCDAIRSNEYAIAARASQYTALVRDYFTRPAVLVGFDRLLSLKPTSHGVVALQMMAATMVRIGLGEPWPDVCQRVRGLTAMLMGRLRRRRL
jgi:hypothetical protein